MATHYTPEWIALSRHVGDALRSPDQRITLSYGTLTGEKMYWRDTRSGTVLVVSTPAWLRWIASVATAQTPADFADAVLDALVQWTLEPVALLLSPSIFSPERLNAKTFAQNDAITGLMLNIGRDDASLPILLLEANWTFLQRQVHDWSPASQPPVTTVPVALSIGSSCVTANELAQLAPGMGLCLQDTPDLRASEVWLTLGTHRASAWLNPPGKLQIIHPFTGTPSLTHQPAGRDIHVKDIPLTLTAEIGQVAITLGELQQLQPGDVLNDVALPDACVQLKVNGYTVAWGQLMQAENGWLVRITAQPEAAQFESEGEDA